MNITKYAKDMTDAEVVTALLLVQKYDQMTDLDLFYEFGDASLVDMWHDLSTLSKFIFADELANELVNDDEVSPERARMA